ncbi:hypothetical protein V6N13_025238 [Hibiscus sabdariffa]|uniref:Uncharacterized protein n=1 Tax=Hibiscus sabdariffa TaxID=183260 RepID=A0ABR2AU98_9ROSI
MLQQQHFRFNSTHIVTPCNCSEQPASRSCRPALAPAAPPATQLHQSAQPASLGTGDLSTQQLPCMPRPPYRKKQKQLKHGQTF